MAQTPRTIPIDVILTDRFRGELESYIADIVKDRLTEVKDQIQEQVEKEVRRQLRLGGDFVPARVAELEAEDTVVGYIIIRQHGNEVTDVITKPFEERGDAENELADYIGHGYAPGDPSEYRIARVVEV